ncbi:MAG: hypothetical protein ACI8QC_001129 [Planctomycetota bacterium]
MSGLPLKHQRPHPMPPVPLLARRLWLAGSLLLSAVLGLALAQKSAHPTVLGRWSGEYALLLKALLTLCALAWVSALPAIQARLWAARAKLLLLGLSLALSLAAGEVLLRVADPLGLNYHDEIARYIGLRQDDSVLAYVQPKDMQLVLDGAHIRFNSLGLRGAEIGPKQPTEKRLLVLGDSVAFGWGVEEQALFGSLLAERLSAQTGSTWTPINAGVCSYNSIQERLYLEHRGLALEPDLVVLVYIDNDVLTYGKRWQQAEASKPPLRRRLKQTLQSSHLVQTLTKVAGDDGDKHATGPERDLGPEDSGWQSNMRALTELVELCAARELDLALYHFRWRSDPWSDSLLEDARKHTAPIPIADTAPWFADLELRDLVNSPTDSHPNPKAHALTAERMHAELQRLGLPKPE